MSGIYGGLFAGVAAISAQSTAFAAISDNIANVNTIGYKETRVRFQTLVTESASDTQFAPGGVIARPFTDPEKQGQIQGTTSDTDLALVGEGFFVVNQTDGSDGQFLFTRAGSFTQDEDGNLVNTAGYYLQGWRTDTTGNIVNSTTQDLLTSLETVNLTGFSAIANPTTRLNIAANLPAASATGTTATTNLTIFDSLGTDHLLTVNWTKSAVANTWTYTVDVTNSNGNTTTVSTGNSVLFNGDGTLNTVDGSTGTSNATALTNLTISAGVFSTGANGSTPTIIWGTFDSSTGLGQFDDIYEATLLNQDGSGPSDLLQVDVDEDGLITGQFRNGETRSLYQLALASVPAATELRQETGNAYALSNDSGELVLGRPGTQGLGFVQSEALERSTVDISAEFTDLIVTQRAYSAATRVITTGDELLDEIIRVKR
ncbi:MAG: flagellar hook protein FlgE [Thalassobaculum sp.]